MLSTPRRACCLAGRNSRPAMYTTVSRAASAVRYRSLRCGFGRLGLHSALSLPLLLPDRVLGAMSVYAHDRDAFNTHAIGLGEAFAGPAAVSVANAQTLAQAQRLVAQLEQALVSRAEIDQALGVVMSRNGVNAAEAFARLRTISQTRQVKLVDVAHQLLQELTSRARAQHTDTGPDPTR